MTDSTNAKLRELRERVAGLACYDGDDDPRLVRIGPVAQTYRRDLWLLTLPELRHTNRIRALMSHLAEQVKVTPSSSNRRARRRQLTS